MQNLKTVLTKYKISDETDEVKQFEALPLSFGTCGILLFPGYLILQQIKFSWKNACYDLEVSFSTLLSLYSKFIVNSEYHTTDSVSYGGRPSNLPFPLNYH